MGAWLLSLVGAEQHGRGGSRGLYKNERWVQGGETGAERVGTTDCAILLRTLIFATALRAASQAVNESRHRLGYSDKNTAHTYAHTYLFDWLV